MAPKIGGDETSNNSMAAKKNTPTGQKRTGGFRKNDTSTIKGNNNLPRTGATSITRLNQSAFINQKTMDRFYRLRKDINMISVFELFKM